MKLTVFFDGQFWFGVLEEHDNQRIKAVKWLFGSEPKDTEVLEFVINHAIPLLQNATCSIDYEGKGHQKMNPKRLARQIAKEMKRKGVSTYAQQAIQKELENKKKARKELSKVQKEENQRRKRAIVVQKKKDKHRGK